MNSQMKSQTGANGNIAYHLANGRLLAILLCALAPMLASLGSAHAQSRDEVLEQVLLSQPAWCGMDSDEEGEGAVYHVTFNEDGTGTFNDEASHWYTGYNRVLTIRYPSARWPGRVQASVTLISATDMVFTWRYNGVVARFYPCNR